MTDLAHDEADTELLRQNPALAAAFEECEKWVRQIGGAALQRNDQDAGLLFCAVMAAASPNTRDAVALPLAVALATSAEGYPDVAAEIERCITRYNAHKLPLTRQLHEYVIRRAQTGIDFTRRKRGGSKWRLVERNSALAGEAFDWRMAQPHDWQSVYQDLTTPSACLDWTLHELTATLDLIEETFGKWSANPSSTTVFFPSKALCQAYGLDPTRDYNKLLSRIYPPRFRGLLIGQVARLCVSEHERRIAAELATGP